MGKKHTRRTSAAGPGMPDLVMEGRDKRKQLAGLCNDHYTKASRQWLNKMGLMQQLRGEQFPASKKFPNNYGACYPKKKKNGKGIQKAGLATTEHRIIEKAKPKHKPTKKHLKKLAALKNITTRGRR